MAELNIGKHCDIKDCHQLDFLPFECDSCSKIFCLEHKSTTSHDCMFINNIKEVKTHDHPTYDCKFEDCSNHELVPVCCTLCSTQFCLQHRLPETHNCKELKSRDVGQTSLQEHMDKIVTNINRRTNIKTTKHKSVKSQKIAAKVELMKMKLKATGEVGIPDENKVYFAITLPYNGEKVVFASCRWTFGRLVDYMSTLCNLRNTNNVSLQCRLQLQNSTTSLIVDSSMTIEQALSEEIVFSGSKLSLCYISNYHNLELQCSS